MEMTFAGRSGRALALSAGYSACVRKKGALTLMLNTLSQPASGNVSKSEPQAAPALLTRMSRAGSRAVNAADRWHQHQRIAARAQWEILTSCCRKFPILDGPRLPDRIAIGDGDDAARQGRALGHTRQPSRSPSRD